MLEWYTGALHDVQFLNHGIPKLVGESPTIQAAILKRLCFSYLRTFRVTC